MEQIVARPDSRFPRRDASKCRDTLPFQPPFVGIAPPSVGNHRVIHCYIRIKCPRTLNPSKRILESTRMDFHEL